MISHPQLGFQVGDLPLQLVYLVLFLIDQTQVVDGPNLAVPSLCTVLQRLSHYAVDLLLQKQQAFAVFLFLVWFEYDSAFLVVEFADQLLQNFLSGEELLEAELVRGGERAEDHIVFHATISIDARGGCHIRVQITIPVTR